MPILVRPVREQLEHDRIIRLLEAKWRRKFKVEANPGDERNAGVKVPVGTLYPDLVVTEEGGRKPKALIEVETNESVNHLEAQAQWANLAKAKTSLLLFVPVGSVESARRLAADFSIRLAEVWTYMVLGDQVRFTSVYRENGADAADLIEKVDVFTTERAAPAPRPIPVEAEPAPAPPPVQEERPRKLAVKIASRVDARPIKLAKAKPAMPTVPPAPASVPNGVAKGAPAKVARAEPSRLDAPKVARAEPGKAEAAKAVKAEPAKVDAAKPAAPKAAPAGKAVAASIAKGDPTHKKAEKVAEKPEKKGIAGPAPAKAAVARKAAEKPEKKTPPAKAPVKAAAKAAKPAAKAAPRPAARTVAAPARPTRVAAARKAPAKAVKPAAKRK